VRRRRTRLENESRPVFVEKILLRMLAVAAALPLCGAPLPTILSSFLYLIRLTDFDDDERTIRDGEI
jgi:hypothetical protein